MLTNRHPLFAHRFLYHYSTEKDMDLYANAISRRLSLTHHILDTIVDFRESRVFGHLLPVFR